MGIRTKKTHCKYCNSLCCVNGNMAADVANIALMLFKFFAVMFSRSAPRWKVSTALTTLNRLINPHDREFFSIQTMSKEIDLAVKMSAKPPEMNNFMCYKNLFMFFIMLCDTTSTFIINEALMVLTVWLYRAIGETEEKVWTTIRIVMRTVLQVEGK